MRGPVDRLTAGLPPAWRTAIDWLVTIALAVGAVLAIKAWVVNPYRIPSASMEPTLHCASGTEEGCTARFSDRVLANRFIYHFREPERGDIIVFNTPEAAWQRCHAGGTFVKRLIGLPGETIDVRRGNVFIDGKRLREPYLRREEQGRTGPGALELPYRIRSDEYFFMGDNRTSSCDSRSWGPAPREKLIGEVFAVYWPPQRIAFR